MFYLSVFICFQESTSFFLLEIQTNDCGRESSFSLFSLILLVAGFLLAVALLITSSDVYLKRSITAILTLVIWVWWTCSWIWYTPRHLNCDVFIKAVEAQKQFFRLWEQLVCWNRFIPALCRLEEGAAVLQRKAVMLKIHWNNGGGRV